MLLLSILMLDFFTLEIFNGVVSSVSSASIGRREWLLMAIMAINGYSQKLNIFLERKLLLFIIYLLFFYQSMIKYNNVNILKE